MTISLRHLPRAGLILLLALGACTRVGDPVPQPAPEPGPAPRTLPDVSGAWTGFVSVEGQGLQGTLQVEQDGEALAVVFDAPEFGMRATGDGRIDADGDLVVTLAYDLQCPGTAELDGRRSDDGMVLDGSLTASDCTGSSGGSFSFRR